jgi:hypothetical protein
MALGTPFTQQCNGRSWAGSSFPIAKLVPSAYDANPDESTFRT